MNTYFIQIVKNGTVLDIARTQADNEDLANNIVDTATRGRGWEGFSLLHTTEDVYNEFGKQAAEKAAADKAEDEQAKAENAGAAEQGPAEGEGNPDTPADPAPAVDPEADKAA